MYFVHFYVVCESSLMFKGVYWIETSQEGCRLRNATCQEEGTRTSSFVYVLYRVE